MRGLWAISNTPSLCLKIKCCVDQLNSPPLADIVRCYGYNVGIYNCRFQFNVKYPIKKARALIYIKRPSAF